jgi:hypothetical protein
MSCLAMAIMYQVPINFRENQRGNFTVKGIQNEGHIIEVIA